VEAIPVIAWGAASIAALLAAVLDARTGRIPNPLTLGALALGLVLAGLRGWPLGLIHGAAGVLACAFVPLLLFRRGAMGGGDVKLLAALGALLGIDGGLEVQTLAFLFGAAHGIASWARSGRLGAGALAVAGLVVPVVGRRWRNRPTVAEAAASSIRFGPAIAAATAAAGVLRLWG
jgi:prepilin peptidase CpaA